MIFQARKIEEHKRKKERKQQEREDREKRERVRKAREAQAKAREEAAKHEESNPDFGNAGGAGGFSQFLNDPEILTAFQVNILLYSYFLSWKKKK